MQKACCGHEKCDHPDDPDAGFADSLQGLVSRASMRVLNELEANSGPRLIRGFGDAMNFSPSCTVSSGADDELLVVIPLTHPAALRSITLVTDPGASAPVAARVFNDPLAITFDYVQTHTPTQEFPLTHPPGGASGARVELPLRAGKFAACGSLSIHLPASFDGEVTRLHFVGLRGVRGGASHRMDLTGLKYEFMADPALQKQMEHQDAGGAASQQGL
eukprot:TRINITY_DN24713_c0_g1_i1.p1 TRINITY_DN24713_c0_g1~~TRINITY_DN24713_c0_g1_i1.p1  ORF type:complete len:218 (-),score=33.25 TRINITY_DN24713_c0_g1_i1:181-834(-)